MKNSLRFPHIETIICLITLLILIFPIKKIIIDKDFYVVVEIPCSGTEQNNCITRDCNNEDCPPNNLTSFKRLQIYARDFAECKSDSCQSECGIKSIVCLPKNN